MSEVTGNTYALLERLTVGVEKLAENTQFIAYGIAKMTERCFCGHLLADHPESGPCSIDPCEMGCKFFLPVQLAIARTLSRTSGEITAIKQMIAGAAGRPLVSPFQH